MISSISDTDRCTNRCT